MSCVLQQQILLVPEVKLRNTNNICCGYVLFSVAANIVRPEVKLRNTNNICCLYVLCATAAYIVSTRGEAEKS